MSALPNSSGRRPVPIRVALADDSAVVRELLSRWLSGMPDVEVVGVYSDGIEAVRHVGKIRPDIMLLDITMPGMDGLTALPLILETSPRTRVLVVSAASVRGADVTLRCLMRGASDYLTKPSGSPDAKTVSDFRTALAESIRALDQASCRDRGTTRKPASPAEQVLRQALPMPAALPAAPSAAMAPELLVIGASTGGPFAVTRLLADIRPALGQLVVVLAQHMPPVFTSLFAEHLGRHLHLPTLEISGGEHLVPGRLHVVRGGSHVTLAAGCDGIVAEPVRSGVTGSWSPSIDLLFKSAAAVGGWRTVGVLLSGLGDDGTAGASRILASGGMVLAQDRPSSVAWGIPGAAVRAGACTHVLPLDRLAEPILSRLKECDRDRC